MKKIFKNTEAETFLFYPYDMSELLRFSLNLLFFKKKKAQ